MPHKQVRAPTEGALPELSDESETAARFYFFFELAFFAVDFLVELDFFTELLLREVALAIV